MHQDDRRCHGGAARQHRGHGRHRRRQRLPERHGRGVQGLLRPVLGPGQGADTADPRQPRLRHHGCERLLRVLRRGRREPRQGLVRVRPGHMAGLRPQQQLRVRGGCGEGSAQLAWLRADLAARPHACVLALWHHARFSSGAHGNNSVSQPLSPHCTPRAPMSCSRGTTTTTSDSRRRPRPVWPTTGDGHPPVRRRDGRQRSLCGRRSAAEQRSARRDEPRGAAADAPPPGAYDWQFLPVPGGTNTDSGTAACHA